MALRSSGAALSRATARSAAESLSNGRGPHIPKVISLLPCDWGCVCGGWCRRRTEDPCEAIVDRDEKRADAAKVLGARSGSGVVHDGHRAPVLGGRLVGDQPPVLPADDEDGIVARRPGVDEPVVQTELDVAEQAAFAKRRREVGEAGPCLLPAGVVDVAVVRHRRERMRWRAVGRRLFARVYRLRPGGAVYGRGGHLQVLVVEVPVGVVERALLVVEDGLFQGVEARYAGVGAEGVGAIEDVLLGFRGCGDRADGVA